MKIKAMVLSGLLAVAILAVGYEYSIAGANTSSSAARIGVVSIREVFEKCERNAKYREEALTEQKKLIAELQKLEAEIEAEKAGLKTLKVGSSDYLDLMKGLLEKQAKLQAQQEFYKRQIEFKDQRWTEDLYQDILKATSKIAEQKGLDLVLEKNQVDIPAESVQDLMMTIRTHKVLYSNGCVNLTDDVITQIDAN